jgi:hypothetical protein
MFGGQIAHYFSKSFFSFAHLRAKQLDEAIVGKIQILIR